MDGWMDGWMVMSVVLVGAIIIGVLLLFSGVCIVSKRESKVINSASMLIMLVMLGGIGKMLISIYH
jgi:uncharacterized membrane protein YqiK